MKKKLDPKLVKFVQDIDSAIAVLQNAAQWLEETGKNPSEWWHPKNMHREFILTRAEPNEFFAALVDGKPAAAAVLQENERNQSWKSIDGNIKQKALYVHWLCITRQFAGMQLPNLLLDFAYSKAKKSGLRFLRLDTSASKTVLRKIYENLGFQMMGVHDGVVYYQKKL